MKKVALLFASAVAFYSSLDARADDSFFYSYSNDVTARQLFENSVNHTNFQVSPLQKLSFAVAKDQSSIIVADNTYKVSGGVLKLRRFHPGDGKELDPLSVNIGEEAYESDATYVGNDDAGNLWLINVGFTNGYQDEHLWVYDGAVDVLLAHVDSQSGDVVNKCNFSVTLNSSARYNYAAVSLPAVMGSMNDAPFRVMLPYYWTKNNVGSYSLLGYEGNFDGLSCIISNENFYVETGSIYCDNFGMENTFTTYFFESEGIIYCVADFLESHPTVYECPYLDKIKTLSPYNSMNNLYDVSGKGFNIHEFNGKKLAVYGLRSHDRYMESGNHDVCLRYVSERDLLNGPVYLDEDLAATPIVDKKSVESRASGDNSRDYLQSKLIKLDNGADCLYTLSSSGLKGYELLTQGKTPSGMVNIVYETTAREKSVFDLSGRCVSNDLNSLPVGVYMMKEGNKVSKFVIK